MKHIHVSKKGHLWQLYTVAKKKGLSPYFFRNHEKYHSLMVTRDGAYKILDGHKLGYYPTTNKHFIEVCNSKIESEKLLKQLGYNILNSTEVQSGALKDSTELEKHLLRNLPADYPLLIKPETGLKGKGIQIANTEHQLLQSVKKLYANNKNFLVQETTLLPEYRILFALGKVVFVHSKGLPTIKGDGTHTAQELFAAIPKEKRDQHFFTQQLHTLQLKKNSVLPKGVTVPYHITRKGTFDTVLAEHIPTGISRWAKKLGKDLGSDTIGIDVFIDGPFHKDTSYRIIEINANPVFVYIKNKYKRADVVSAHCARILDTSFPE